MFTDWPSLPRTISVLFLFREPLIDCTGPAHIPETGPGSASRVTGVSMLYEEVIMFMALLLLLMLLTKEI